MSILSQNTTNNTELFDCVERFFSKHHIGNLLAKCNGTKEKEYRMLTLGWSNGCIFLPINSCLVASSNESFILGPVKSFDKRTIAGKRRFLAQMKAVDSMQEFLKLTDDQMEAFMIDFSLRLPEYLQKGLNLGVAAA